MVESWKADADGILIFVRLYLLIWCFTPTLSAQTGLFSAAIASLISVSIRDIRQDPQDTSNFYLANIYQTLADPNRPNISSSLPASPRPFSPPNYAVWVNALWFLSLVISLTCALLSTLLQQWARRYLKVTQPRYAPHKQARIRAFLAEGVEKFLLPWTVEALPTLLHISLFLFFAGLVMFLWNVDLTIFKLVLSWVGICTALYGCITVMPIFRHDSPYLTPLSLPAWHIVTGLSFLTFRALRRLAFLRCFSRGTYVRFRDLAERYGRWLVQGMQKTAEETALNSPPDIDTRAFLWAFDSLDEDHELERFFSGLPGFRNSKVVRDPLPTLAEERKEGLFTALAGLLDRTFSSNLLSEHVKNRRATICIQAIDPAHTTKALSVLNKILTKYQYGDPLVAEIVQIIRGWEINLVRNTTLHEQATFSKIVARAQPRDDSWFILGSKSLGVPEGFLRGYAAHGDSLSLAILIHITRMQYRHFWIRSWSAIEFSNVLLVASTFNVQDTSPALQHEFCALWNQIVNAYDGAMAFFILGRIRNVYLALHQDTDSAPTQFSPFTGDEDHILYQPYSYPVCNVPGHHPDATPHIHDNSASTTFARAVPHDHDETPIVPSIPTSSPDMPSLSAHAPLRVEESFTDAPPRDNIIPASVSLRPIDRTTTESCRNPATSPNPVNTRLTHGSIDTTRPSTPEPLAFSPLPMSKASTSLPDAVAVEHTPLSPTPSLEVPLSHPSQVLDDMLPPGLPLTLCSPVTGADHVSALSESHPSVIAPGASRPWLSSAPDLDAAAEGEGSAKPALRKEMEALYPTSAIREVITANPDLPPQLPSPSSPPIIDVATRRLSHSSLYAEFTGHHPPRPSHDQNDVI